MKLAIGAPLVTALALTLSLGASTGTSAQGVSALPRLAKPADPTGLAEPARRRGRDIAIGLGILGTAIVLSEAARADGRRRYRRNTYCGRLLYRCDEGSDRACEQYYYDCG